MDLPLLPTTMVGSYPRPGWFRHQLEGRDVLEAFKLAAHAEAFDDAVRVVVDEQARAGLDVVTDGQMWFDDYQMGIGSFLWYWLERIHGFGREKLRHPARAKASGADAFVLDEAGGVAVRGPIARGPIRMAELYRLAAAHTTRPLKACVGAGPIQLSTLAHFESGPIRDRHALARALAPVFRAEIEDLLDAGCPYIQLEDLGAWIPNLSGERDFAWVREVVDATLAGVRGRARTAWHFCLGNAWGSTLRGMTAGGYGKILARYADLESVDEFVLDYACREMAGVEALACLPEDKRVAVGVVDVRSLEIESPEQIVERVRKVLAVVPAERVTLTTDCGMKQLPRPVAAAKLASLTEAARRVRQSLVG